MTVLVIGGAHLDVLARSSAPLRAHTSNPGTTVRTFGGVGRNVAENLARLGTPTRMLLAVGDVAGHGTQAATTMAQLRHALRALAVTTGDPGALLGHQYYLDGTVIRGDGRGRTLGFPTANLCTENELVPPHGVYATTTTVAGVVRPSISNVGTRPTVDASGRTAIETHIFDFDRDLYGAAIRLAFVQRLRDERAFESVDVLKTQIAADCARARVLFDRLSL